MEGDVGQQQDSKSIPATLILSQITGWQKDQGDKKKTTKKNG